jgi:hypothetical protein
MSFTSQSYGQVPVVVPAVFSMLAVGAVSVDSVSHRLAYPATVPDFGDCRAWGAGIGRGGYHVTGKSHPFDGVIQIWN